MHYPPAQSAGEQGLGSMVSIRRRAPTSATRDAKGHELNTFPGHRHTSASTIVPSPSAGHRRLRTSSTC